MEDQDYFYRRAEAELQMAQAATAPEAVKVHYELAGYYLDRVHGCADELAERASA